MSDCVLQRNMAEGLSWFEATFLPVVLVILLELIGSGILKSTDRFEFHHHIPSGKKLLIGNGFIFQHDNDPEHTANAVTSYLERKTADKTLTVMDRPPQSPELNILEAVWDQLHRERNKRQNLKKNV